MQTLAIAPLPWANRLALVYARWLDAAIPRLRGVGRQNLQIAFPSMRADARDLVIDGVYESIARILVAFAKFPEITPQTVSSWIRYEGFEHFAAGLARGKGVLFATGHLGNWELSAFTHALMSAPMHVVVRPLDNWRIDRMVEKRRGISGNFLIGKKDFARSILKALHRNEAVGILVDQNAALDSGVFVDFFGTAACANGSFARIAARSGAAVIPGFAFWSANERRYILRFYPEVPMTGDVRHDTAEIQRAIEEAVREYPEQWLWLHRRWKTRPPGEDSLYSQGKQSN